jgi:hypothetical protein
MKNVIDIVNDAILDVCANPLVENGTFDPNNNEHMFLLMETLDGNLEEEYISKAISALRCEGKHPERQAYNKEGWLVTFPSKEYRDAAIKKGTHSLSDPTHGKGGMNLYYKRRGKQKRIPQQATTTTEPQEQPQVQKPAPTTAKQQTEPTSSQTQDVEPTVQPEKEPEKSQGADVEKADTSALPKSDSATVSSDADSPNKKDTEPSKPSPQMMDKDKKPDSAEQPIKNTVTSSFKDVTEKFAASKGWTGTPYGEWRDTAGSTVAVVSLSGEVTPLKSTDREELKLFSNKQG